MNLKICAIGLGLAFGGSFATAKAATAILQLNGSVTGVHQSLTADFTLGAPVTTIVAYDFRPADGINGGVKFYDAAVLGGFSLIGGYFIGFSDAARLITADDMPTGDERPPFDRFLFDNFLPNAALANGEPLTVFSFGFEDSTGTALDFHGLPSSASDLAGFSYRPFSLDFGDYLATDLHRVSGEYSSFTLNVFGVVPEPSSWAMLIIGFGLLGSLTRRQRSMLHLRQIGSS